MKIAVLFSDSFKKMCSSVCSWAMGFRCYLFGVWVLFLRFLCVCVNMSCI